MQELTFEQVEVVSGGQYWEMDSAATDRQLDRSYTDSTGGAAVRTGSIGAGGAGASVLTALAKGSIAAGAAVAGLFSAVGTLAGLGYDLATEGRDNNRVQNHPATKHLYGPDGKLL